jgi:hypothetical protein
MPRDVDMQDANAAKEEAMQYGNGGMSEAELNEK